MSAVSAITGFAHLTDLPCYELTFAHASAVISAYGAQVLSYKPTTSEELLWLSPRAAWHNQQPIRGGVPICWPWFGPAAAAINPHNHTLPNHGLVRTQMWQHHSQQCTPDYTQLCLVTTAHGLPHTTLQDITVQLTVRLTATSLTIQLCCNHAIQQQAALHSYFGVTTLAKTAVQGVGNQYIDKTQSNALLTNNEPLRFNQEIDRIYCQPDADLQLATGSRTLGISQQGFDSTVVWNPAQARCATIADLAPDSYQHFVCVESARLALTPQPLALTQCLHAPQHAD